MISWLGNADQWMLKMRPSPGRQSTAMMPLLIFQSVELLVSMVICAWVAEGTSNRAHTTAERRSRFMGEPPSFKKSGDRAAGLVVRERMLEAGIKFCQSGNYFKGKITGNETNQGSMGCCVTW